MVRKIGRQGGGGEEVLEIRRSKGEGHSGEPPRGSGGRKDNKVERGDYVVGLKDGNQRL